MSQKALYAHCRKEVFQKLCFKAVFQRLPSANRHQGGRENQLLFSRDSRRSLLPLTGDDAHGAATLGATLPKSGCPPAIWRFQQQRVLSDLPQGIRSACAHAALSSARHCPQSSRPGEAQELTATMPQIRGFLQRKEGWKMLPEIPTALHWSELEFDILLASLGCVVPSGYGPGHECVAGAREALEFACPGPALTL